MSLRWMVRVVLLTCLGWALPAKAEVRAWLDREQVALGETVTLNIEVQGAGVAAPDFSPLDAEFERRGSSSSSQISLVNGQRSATTLFAVSLQPRREGELRVPSILVGGERTPELKIAVGPSPIDTGSGGDVFLEATLGASEVYVQQEVVYSLKLFYALSLWDGQLDAPTGEGLQSVRLGDDLKYQVERAGRRYSVIERRFALIPERSGTLTVEAARFEGTGLERGGYGGLIGSGGIRLSAAGKPLTLEVKPRPAGAEEPWLPAAELQLDSTGESWPAEIRVGEPLSLGLQLRAKGLLPAQLPELELPPIAGAAVYPDQAASRDLSSGEGLAGERFRRFAIVPQKPGTLEIPAVRLPWWDTGEHRQRWAELPARRIEVLPAAGTAAPSDPGAASSGTPADKESFARGPASPAYGLPAWPFMLLSLVLAVGWWLSLRRRALQVSVPAPAAPVEPSAAAPDLKAALREGDAHAISSALQALAPPGYGHSLRAVASALADVAQRDAVLALERHRFAPPGIEPASPVEALRAAFARGPVWRASDAGAGRAASRYPPLYG
ncbi:BatD family protein [Pseudomarimonas salicorniae]|uniref:BatD family protein n=1 Tax=Pseudomarimonas salicorniae TaxID=2933270 RepID=A0ABT0GJ25_9GAMM|nr:BatD family protein [Lysobacter sp. CAU 1642]MCK7594564.1 BatD family protein [Lysobacter sp. CAU 1642]